LHKKSYKEVAAVLDISTSGVRKYIMKRLAIIRKDFDVNYKKGLKKKEIVRK